MENYKLKEDEVVLFKNEVKLSEDNGSTELVLTNQNLVFINKHKKLFKKEEVQVFEYSISDIKMYEGMPHIKTKGHSAEIYLKENEICVEFLSKGDLHKFINEANKLMTGETSAQRGAKKVRDAIDVVDKALGINTVEAVGNVIKYGVDKVVSSVTGGVGNATGKIIDYAGEKVKGLIENKKKDK